MSLSSNIADLATRIATENKSLRTLINGNAETLSALDTTAKANLVAAINEVAGSVGASAGIDDATTSTSSTWSSSKTTSEIASQVAGLVDDAPGTLDTLRELAQALDDDPNFATTVAAQIAGKQPINDDLTAIAGLASATNTLPYATGPGAWALTPLTAAGRALIDDADAATQRATLGVPAAADVGPTGTNFVTVFEAGLD